MQFRWSPGLLLFFVSHALAQSDPAPGLSFGPARHSPVPDPAFAANSALTTAANPPAGIVYTCDPSVAVTVCSYLNSAIAAVYSSAFTNANASIYVTFGPTGLGESYSQYQSISYSAFRTALVAGATSTNDNTAIANSVPASNSLGNGMVDLTNANYRALGFTPTHGVTPNQGSCVLGSANCYDGIVTISSQVKNAGQFYFRTGTINSNQYDFYTVVEHETDEVLGTPSCAFGCGGDISPTDLFRYHSDGTRSFASGSNSPNCTVSSAQNACFSLDGVHMLMQYNNVDNGEDAGDWVTNCSSQRVQDAGLCPGLANLDISPTAEIELLDVIGFTLAGSSAVPTVTSSLVITPAGPYSVNQTVNAQFTITNQGGTSMVLQSLAAGGRVNGICPANVCPDFTHMTNLTVAAGQSYSYSGSLQLPQSGTYSFFVAYQTPGGTWNTSVPTANGITGSVTLTVAPAPSVTTSAATSIAASTAGLQGSVNPNGADTHVWFVYGSNASLTGGISTAQQDIGAGTSGVPVSATLSGLTANTTYYFQLWASNSGGTTQDAILSFTTSAAPLPDLVVTSLTAPNNAIPGASIGVSMTVANQGNAAAGMFAVGFYFSATPSISITSVDTGLRCNFSALSQGASTSCSVLVPVPTSLSAGSWYFGAIADPANQVAESNKSNNSRLADSGPIVLAVPTYTISGTASLNGSSLAGVTVTLSGSQTASTTTDSNGNYGFSGLGSGASYTVTPALTGYTFSPSSQTFSNLSGNHTANFVASPVANITISGQATAAGAGLSGVTINVNGSQTLSTTTDVFGSYSLTLPSGGTYILSAARSGYTFSAPLSFANLTGNQTANFSGVAIAGLEFFTVTPCRVADTRSGAGFSGFFGPPSLGAGTQRSFPVPASACGIPANAAAYSLNVTAVPHGTLGYLTIWPTGQPIPGVSTLNSYSGTVVANAAIVPAGAGGAISVFVTDSADVLFDINGYFAPPQGNGLQFFPVTPCRVADTRAGGGKTGAFGPSTMASNTQRSFPIPLSSCGIPPTAAAYSLNFTVVPQTGYLGFLTTWPTGQPQPNISTLNSYNGTVVANAAIVPAGNNGSISVFVTDTTDVLFDINGYFASPQNSGLQFYPVSPCRVADTRAAAGKTGPLGPPSMTANTPRSFPVPSSTCSIPPGAGAYSFNFTVVPPGYLGALTAWPTGLAMPGVSTLNSYTGAVVANAAIVPAGSAGAISVSVLNPTDVLFDINGYFAP